MKTKSSPTKEKLAERAIERHNKYVKHYQKNHPSTLCYHTHASHYYKQKLNLGRLI